MKLNRMSRRLLGIATLWNPIAAVGLLAGLALYPFVIPTGGSLKYPKDQLLYFALGALVMAMLGLVILVTLAFTTIVYAFHIVRNERLSRGKKVLWSLLNLTLGLFAMPLYWYRHVSPGTATSESTKS